MKNDSLGIKHSPASDLTDTFALKNYIFTGVDRALEGISIGDPFVFDGIIFVIGLKGDSVIKINHRKYTLREGVLLTIMPRQIFQLEEKSTDSLIETLWVSSEFTHELPLPKEFNLLKRMGEDPCLKIGPETKNDLLELHSLVVRYHRKEDTHYRERMVRALIYTLMLRIASEYLQDTGGESIQPPSRQEELTQLFFELLLAHFIRERSVAFYAGKLCLTPKYLSMTVKKITGHSILDWINLAVIIEAKKMLKTTDRTILQISEDLSFPNPSFFGHFFKQHAKVTPLQYRNG